MPALPASGVAAHTWMSSRISDVKFNGVSASEGYINAVLAGEFVVLDITSTSVGRPNSSRGCRS
jgi:D-aminopeptidase